MIYRFAFLMIFIAAPSLAQAQSKPDVHIHINPDAAEAWSVSPTVFGRFFEHNGRDAYPGLYDQHLANGSFEPWYAGGHEQGLRRTELIYENIEEYAGVAIPWEPVGPRRVFWDNPQGGENGYRYQRITVFSPEGGGIKQRIALPDHRTRTYDLHLTRRGTTGELVVRLASADGSIHTEERLAVARDWQRDTLRLELPAVTEERYQDSPFGEYVLSLLVEEKGLVDVDAAMLMAGDAVDGKYNPTTIEWLKEFNVLSMRWPGGNWASAYHWMDGVGPTLDRPIRQNLHWAGLEPNYFGTNEFLEFCRLTGMEPFINAAFNYFDVPPEEAAQWVEYVNGDTSTAMGRLRAEHGYPEPWGVEFWQVGNETYGAYQIGHEDAESFARKFAEYVRAMKEVDPSITVLAAGADPLYHDWNAMEWNETLFELSGAVVDGVDIHRYVRGVRDAGETWSRDEYLRNIAAFPTMFEDILEMLRESAAERGISDLQISVGEWNANPRVPDEWPSLDYPTMAHASFVAGMYNAFIRQGEAVRFSYQRDNTLWFRPYPGDFRPVNPGSYVLQLFAEPFEADIAWHHVPLEVNGPTFFLKAVGDRQQDTPDVPFVDASAVVSTDRGAVVVYLTNRDLLQHREVSIDFDEAWLPDRQVGGVFLHSTDPFKRQTQWDRLDGFSRDALNLRPAEDGSIRLTMPPASVARLDFSVRKTSDSVR